MKSPRGGAGSEAGEALIRPALEGEADASTRLALRSKAHWGHDEQFLESCRADLTVTRQYVATSPVFVLEAGGRRAGFYGLLCTPPAGRLEYLFVEPASIGRGYGRRLWRHAVETAGAEGFTELEIGAIRERRASTGRWERSASARRPPALPGRTLPVLRFDVAPAPGR